MKNILINIIFALVLLAPLTINAQSPRDTLNQYVAELQKSPNDNTLREKIILISLRIKPAPAIPENANEKLVMGITFKDGKAYELAIKSLNEALLIAPWWGEAYKELGLTLELAEKFDEAITVFQLYLNTNPGEEMVVNTKIEIAKVKAKKEMAVKEKIDLKAKVKKSFEGHWVQYSPAMGTLYGTRVIPLSIMAFNFDISFDLNGEVKVIKYYGQLNDNGKWNETMPQEFRGRLVNDELLVNPIVPDGPGLKRELRFSIVQQGLFQKTTLTQTAGGSEWTIEFNLRR